MTRWSQLIVVGTCLALPAASLAGGGGTSMLTNADFAAVDGEGMPVGWRVGRTGQKLTVDRSEAPDGCGQSLRVDILAAHSNYGEVEQKVQPIEPNGVYVLTGKVKATPGTSPFSR